MADMAYICPNHGSNTSKGIKMVSFLSWQKLYLNIPLKIAPAKTFLYKHFETSWYNQSWHTTYPRSLVHFKIAAKDGKT